MEELSPSPVANVEAQCNSRHGDIVCSEYRICCVFWCAYAQWWYATKNKSIVRIKGSVYVSFVVLDTLNLTIQRVFEYYYYRRVGSDIKKAAQTKGE